MSSSKDIVGKCCESTHNRFDLTVMAFHYAKSMLAGGSGIFDNNDKSVIMAFRDISSGKVSTDAIREGILSSYSDGSNIVADKYATVLKAPEDSGDLVIDESEFSDDNGFVATEGLFSDKNADPLD